VKPIAALPEANREIFADEVRLGNIGAEMRHAAGAAVLAGMIGVAVRGENRSALRRASRG
jgi:hypothetical protein